MTNHDDENTPTLFTLAAQVRDKALRNLGRDPREPYDRYDPFYTEYTIAYDLAPAIEGVNMRATVGSTFKTYEAAKKAIENSTVRNYKNVRVERRTVTDWEVVD